MKTVRRISSAIAVCLLFAPALLQAKEALFVFWSAQPTASVYDARDFQLLARPVVGSDSFHAAAVPNSSDPLKAGKFYVAARSSVIVLDSEYANAGVIHFGEELPRERQAIVVAGNGERLLVAAGTKVYLVDTADDSIAATLDTGIRLRGILLSADGSQAFAFAYETSAVRIIDIAASRLLNAAVTLPQVPTALAAGPGRGMFATSENGVYDLESIALPRFQTQPVLSGGGKSGTPMNGSLAGRLPFGGGGSTPTGAGGGPSFDSLAIAGDRRFFASASGRLYAASIGTPGGLTTVADPATGLPLDRIGAIASAGDGNSVFATVDGERKLLKIDASNPATAQEISLDATPAGVAAVTTVVEQNAFAYQIVSGNNQSVGPNTNFQLSVKAVNNVGGPVAGDSIFLEAQIPANPAVECNMAVTGADGIGTITCSADDTAVAVALALRVAGLTFNVTITPTSSAPGALVKLSPDFRVIGQGAGFNVAIEAQDANGNPQPNVLLTITLNLGNAFLTCPDKQFTGSDGRVSIGCATGFFNTQQTLIITFSDSLGRTAVYTYTLSPVAVITGLQKIEGDFQTVQQNSPFNMTVQANDLSGNPRPNFILTISRTPGSPTLTCPSSVVTTNTGAATFTCTTGTLSVQTAASITVSDGQTSVTFSATLRPGNSTAPGLNKVSGDLQTVLKNSPFQLVVQSNNGSGIPRANATLLVSTNVSAATATCPTQVQTNLNGQATITCTAGNVAATTNVQVSVNDSQGSVVVFTVTIIPATTIGDGFRKVSGDNQVTIPNVALQQPLIVESLVNGVPQTNAVFTVTTSPSNRLLCSSTVIGNELGRGSITCVAGSASVLTTVNVFVIDNLGRSLPSPFKVTIFPGSGTPPDVLTLLTPSSISGAAGATLQNAIAVRASKTDATVLPGALIAFSTTQDAVFSPPADVTDNDGVARTSVTLGCNAGSVRVYSPFGGPELTVSYSVTAGGAGQMTKVQGDNQSGSPGQLLNQVALVVRLSDICGTPASRIPVGWSVNPPDAATLVNTVGVSDGSGRSSTLVRLGNRPGPLTVTATSGTLTAAFTLTVTPGNPSAPLAGFVNAASFRPGWVPGSAGAIFGTGLMDGINGVVSADSVPFPTTFRGVRVLVNGVPAPIIHLINRSGAEQINLQVPFQTAIGTATVIIENNGRSATIPGVPILSVQPGMFVNPANGFAAALHASNFQPVTAANPARPNEIIALFLTGLGQVTPAVATNAPGPVPPAVPLASVVVGIDNAGMETLGAFYAPGLRTAYQINFRVGANVQSGNRKLAVVANGVAAVDAFLPVQR